MGKFNRGDKFGGKKRFDGDRDASRGGGRERPQMHRAVCSDCGANCEVPFRPTGDKPVYCSDCFSRGGKGGGNKSVVDTGQYKKQFEAINSKLDYVISLLSPEKAVEKKSKEEKIAKKAVEEKVEKKKEPEQEVVLKKESASKKKDKKDETKKKESAPKKKAKKKK